MKPNDTTVERNRLAIYGATGAEWRTARDIMVEAVKLREGAPVPSDEVDYHLRKLRRAGIVESRRGDGRWLVWRRVPRGCHAVDTCFSVTRGADGAARDTANEEQEESA